MKTIKLNYKIVRSQIIAFLILFAFINFLGNAQNLVQNPSFETISSCPMGISEFTKATFWDDTNTNVGGDSCSSPDLYATCSWQIGGANSPNALLGYQSSRTGNNHAGVILESRIPILSTCPPTPGFAIDDYREYITGSLSSALVAGQQYCVKFYVSLANLSGWGLNRMGVYFSASGIAKDFCASPTPLTFAATNPQLLLITNPTPVDTSGWVLMQGNYTAVGGETKFTIGHLLAENNGTLVRTGNNCAATNLIGGSYCYYFIDDVSVTPGACSACPALTSNVSQTNVTCNGGNNGSATITPSGGTGAYSYNWTPSGGNSGTASNLSAGTYTVNFTDANTCPGSTTVTITQPSAITTNTSSVNASCGSANGSASVTALGGTGTLMYSWSPGGQTTGTIINQQAGTYTCVVTDANSCSTSVTVAINSNGGPSVLLSNSSNIQCFGDSTGSASVTASGGTGTLSYSWSPTGGNGASAIGLPAGNYVCTVTDQGNCATSVSVSITQPTAITALQNSIPASCGLANGSATVNANGGTGTLTYLWNPGGNNNSSITNLSSGTYTCIVTDGNSCTETFSVTVNDVGSPIVSINTQTNVACFDSSDGTASVSVSGGGSSPYTYVWSNGQVGSNVSGLSAGTYTAYVTDANSCVDSVSVTISQPQDLVINLVNTIPSACTANSGAATVNIGGGVLPYTAIWSNGQTGTSASGLSAGNYTLTVTDNNGCIDTLRVSINNAGGASLSLSSTGNVSCNGGSDGNLSLASSGGAQPVNYVWSNGQTGLIATNLSAGSYTMTATDAAGCISTYIGIVSQPSPLFLSQVNTSPSNCTSPTGSASVSASGGNSGYVYTWSNGASGASVSNLAAGSYTVGVIDALGCSASVSILVSSINGPVIAINNQTNVSCNGGTNGAIILNVSGGTSPYTTTWSNGSVGATLSNVSAGTYTATVSDAAGCVSQQIISISEPQPLSITIGGNNGVCINQSITLTAGGAVNYSWLPTGQLGNSYTISPNSDTLIGLIGTDASGCTDTVYTNVILHPQPQANFTFSPQPDVFAGTPVNFSNTSTGSSLGLFDFGINNSVSDTSSLNSPLFTYSDTGVYCIQLVVANAQGCLDTAVKCLGVILKEIKIEIPNIITPNGDGINDFFFVKAKGIKELSCSLYDRWGKKVSEYSGVEGKWSPGKTDAEVSSGTFYYVIDYTTIDDTKENVSGFVQVVKSE